MARNALVIVLDTTRADAFEPYGAATGSSPATAQLASSGQAVEDVFATASWTLPSHASMFTGLLPRALGLTQAPGGTPHGARPVLEAHEDRFLPAVLRRAGYETRAVSANLWVSPYAGFETGFDDFSLVKGVSRVEQVERDDIRGRATWAFEGLRARTDDGASEAEATIRGWLDEPTDKPFFWFVNLVEAHSPYLPPRPYNDLGPLDRIRAANEARRYLSLEAIWRTCLMDFGVPDDALARMRHLYARSVRMLDDWLARLLESLDARGILDDTLVLVTSDHGENFGEGGLLAHAFSLDDRLIRVPFVANRPDFIQQSGATSLAELPQLLANYLGVPDHPWQEPLVPPGFAPAQFDFIEEDDPRVQIGVDAWGLDEDARALMTSTFTCVTDGGVKLVDRDGALTVHDLAIDPLEANPLDPDSHPDPSRIAALKAALADPAVQARGEAGPAPAPGPAEDVEDLENRMKLLGYL